MLEVPQSSRTTSILTTESIRDSEAIQERDSAYYASKIKEINKGTEFEMMTTKALLNESNNTTIDILYKDGMWGNIIID